MHYLKFRLTISIVLLLLISIAVLGQHRYKYVIGRWAWWIAPLTVNDLVRLLPVVAVGELVDVRSAPGIRVRIPALMYNTNRLGIMKIRVHSTLKGNDLVSPGLTVEALVLPEVGGYVEAPVEATFLKANEEYKQSGSWPWYWHYPKVGLGEKRIFFLDKVREGKDDVEEEAGPGEVRWIGSRQSGRRPYAYAQSLPADPEVLLIVKRYAEINAIRKPEQREQELLKFSLSLLEDRNVPRPFDAYAVHDLYGGDFTLKPPALRFNDDQIKKLITVATDRSRPGSVRSWITLILETVHKYSGRRIEIEPFLQVVVDTQENLSRRLGVIHFLEQLNTPEVREGFKKILQREPTDQYEAGLWERIKRSKILKDEEPHQE